MSVWMIALLCLLSFGVGLVVGITMFIHDNP